MSKFVIVKEIPQELKQGEYAIGKPSFLEQIALHKAKKPRNGLTGSHYIRMITDSIAQAFDPENLTAYSIKAHKYEGRPFSSDEEMDAIMVDAFRQDCPSVFPKYLEYKIRNRPSGTTLIYYVDTGIRNQYEIFYKNGVNELEKEVKAKSDKIVGKPAITKEQAEALKNQVDTE